MRELLLLYMQDTATGAATGGAAAPQGGVLLGQT